MKDFWKKLVEEDRKAGNTKPFEIKEIINPIKSSEDSVILAYSLFGTKREEYFDPLKNSIVEFSKSIPSNWHFRVYVCKKCIEWINELRELNKVELYVMDDPVGGRSGTFWRFLVLTEPVNAIIADSDVPFEFHESLSRKLEFFSHDIEKIARVRHYPPNPGNYHISADLIMKKASAVLPYDDSFIKNYPCRKYYGTDEIFTTIEVAPHWEKLPGGVIRNHPYFASSLLCKNINEERIRELSLIEE